MTTPVVSSIIDAITPINVAVEKEKFFADPTYNPQLEYRRSVETVELTQWGTPQDQLAQACLEKFSFIRANHPRVPHLPKVVETEVRDIIADFNQRYSHLPPVEVAFDAHQLSQCRISNHQLSFRTPLSYTTAELLGVCRHELETHYLRYSNHLRRDWPLEIMEDNHFRRTEEGLAILHTNLTLNRFMTKSFRNYATIWLAQQGSFREVYDKLISLGIKPQAAWRYTLRSKRGLRDTSQPGGQTKDICYLEGALQVWSWLQNPSHDPRKLYFGRIALSDVKIYEDQINLDDVIYPTFMTNLTEYRELISQIDAQNDLASLYQIFYDSTNS